MFEAVPFRNARRRGIQKHQRTEDDLLARAAPDQMENEGKRDRGRTGQEQWCKKTHKVKTSGLSFPRSLAPAAAGFKHRCKVSAGRIKASWRRSAALSGLLERPFYAALIGNQARSRLWLYLPLRRCRVW